ncbi:MAG: DUF4259 domain-containing protein [Planctomycetaceae bacterium]|nr:DUF4259 domain-containing protein [Planctomycetaceae bacterium]
MGTWDFAPWENDTAADWFANIFNETSFANHIEEALKRDIDEYPEVIRAATAVLIMLGRLYVWPIEILEDHLKLAIGKMELCVEAGVFADETPLVEKEILTLKARLKDLKGSSEWERLVDITQ